MLEYSCVIAWLVIFFAAIFSADNFASGSNQPLYDVTHVAWVFAAYAVLVLGILGIKAWAIVDVVKRSDEFYNTFPRN